MDIDGNLIQDTCTQEVVWVYCIVPKNTTENRKNIRVGLSKHDPIYLPGMLSDQEMASCNIYELSYARIISGDGQDIIQALLIQLPDKIVNREESEIIVQSSLIEIIQIIKHTDQYINQEIYSPACKDQIYRFQLEQQKLQQYKDLLIKERDGIERQITATNKEYERRVKELKTPLSILKWCANGTILNIVFNIIFSVAFNHKSLIFLITGIIVLIIIFIAMGFLFWNMTLITKQDQLQQLKTKHKVELEPLGVQYENLTTQIVALRKKNGFKKT